MCPNERPGEIEGPAREMTFGPGAIPTLHSVAHHPRPRHESCPASPTPISCGQCVCMATGCTVLQCRIQMFQLSRAGLKRRTSPSHAEQGSAPTSKNGRACAQFPVRSTRGELGPFVARSLQHTCSPSPSEPAVMWRPPHWPPAGQTCSLRPAGPAGHGEICFARLRNEGRRGGVVRFRCGQAGGRNGQQSEDTLLLVWE